MPTGHVGIAVAGTGFGARTVLPAFRAIDGVRLVALCGGANHSKTRAIAQEYQIPQVEAEFGDICRRADVDLVAIAAPHEFHRAMVADGLGAQKNILCEKPLALTTSEIDDLVERSRAAPGLHLMNHQLRFHPAIRATRDALRAGTLGVPYQVDIAFQTDRYVAPGFERNAWWFDVQQGGGMLTAMAPHLIDLVQFWFGNSVRTVHHRAHDVLDQIELREGRRCDVKAESAFHSCLLLDGSVSVSISCTAVSFRATSLAYSIFGSEGELTFRTPNELTLGSIRDGRVEQTVLFSNRSYDTVALGSVFHHAFCLFARDLVNALQTGDSSPIADATDFCDYRYKHEVMLALRRSQIEGAAVDLLTARAMRPAEPRSP
jgi:predicted dehydrogenase